MVRRALSLQTGSRVTERQKIVVIGGGAAGISAAYLLQQKYEVTLLEAGSYLGGHTNTVVVEEGADKGLCVDTGFIVLNDQTYPTLHELFRRWGVAWRFSNMSFGFHCERSGLQYAGTGLNGLFSQRRNLFDPRYLRMLCDVRRFGKVAAAALVTKEFDSKTVGEFLDIHHFGKEFIEDYLLPIGAAIWSAPSNAMRKFPLSAFLGFFKNHGLLSLQNRPRWQTVVGGSHAYVKAFRSHFKGEILICSAVEGVRRTAEKVLVRYQGADREFDLAVIATHADQALTMLQDPTPLERELLSPWSYQKNHTVLHTDASFLPPLKRAWASWNYRREITKDDSQPLSVTYHMNRLQGLASKKEYCVTLNPSRMPQPHTIIKEITYHHPLYSLEAIKTQPRLEELQGKNRTYYCGSYFRFGFHEDAVSSGVAAAKHLGCGL